EPQERTVQFDKRLTAITWPKGESAFIADERGNVYSFHVPTLKVSKYAKVTHDILNISAASNTRYMFITGKQNWTLIDTITRAQYTRNMNTDQADFTNDGRVFYADSDASIATFDPKTGATKVVYKSDFTQFHVDEAGTALFIFQAGSVTVIDLRTSARKK